MDRHTRIPTTHNCSTITQKQFLVPNQMKKKKKKKKKKIVLNQAKHSHEASDQAYE
jgi:hypothetical protein